MFDPPLLTLSHKDTSRKLGVNRYRKIFTDKKTDGKNLIENWTYILSNNNEETNDNEILY